MRAFVPPKEVGGVPMTEIGEVRKTKDADLARQQVAREQEPAPPAHLFPVVDVDMADVETEGLPHLEG